MRSSLAIAMMMLGSGAAWAADGLDSSRALRVLYVGNIDTERGRSYARFLGEHFNLVGSSRRESFDPRSASNADVVVLDWSWSDAHQPGWSPLGGRKGWEKPTVLLGSAGLLVAMEWKVFGGRG
jgi:hypothetical protein